MSYSNHFRIGAYAMIALSAFVEASSKLERLQKHLVNFSYASDNCSSLFDEFASTFEKTYISAEERNHRQTVLCNNARTAVDMNLRNDTFKFGINIFSDMSPVEFEFIYLKPINMEGSLGNLTSGIMLRSAASASYPSTYETSCPHSVKDQGRCGSGAIFAAMAALESAYYEKFHSCTSYSEQQMMDCGGFGCDGNRARDVIQWAAGASRKTGICQSWSYSYKASNQLCQLCTSPKRFAIPHIWYTDNAATLRSMIYQYGATTIAFYVDSEFAYYHQGVYTCRAKGSPNHAVAAVGYGWDGMSYFKMQNSWGVDWGMDGYFHLAEYACGMLDVPYHVNAVELDYARSADSSTVLV